jgi:hypothetical protein
MMLPEALQYQGKLKQRVNLLFVWMELYQFTFHHLENWCLCDIDGSWREHKYRKMKRYFDNTVEKDSASKRYTGKIYLK